MKTFIILGVWLVGVTVLYFVFTRRSHARMMRERMVTTHAESLADQEPDPAGPVLASWLSRAGFRAPGSSSAFIIATTLCALAGLGLALLLTFGGWLEPLKLRAIEVSEGIGGLSATMLDLLPWALFLFLAVAPWLYVRNKRRERIDSIERELPILLELLATLSESGLGFDASFSKILDSENEVTPLVEEFRLFQGETAAGISRVRSFRRLVRRVEVTSMTIFCAAMIQAEQIGAGFSSVLRTQALDLRSRRRERAMIKAQALPVKLVFPLVICFLPGIFVTTLGPAFMEFFDMAQGVMSGR